MAEASRVGGIRDWGEAMMTSVTGARVLFLGAIPKIIGFVIIIVVGWFIAGLIAKDIAVILRRINFNNMACASGSAASSIVLVFAARLPDFSEKPLSGSSDCSL